MGYCTYGGKPVPGNNQASCIGGGGNWVSEPSLMSDPSTGQGIPMTGINPEWDAPLQGGAKYGDPTDAILTGAMLAPGVGPAIKGGKALSSKLPVKSIMDKLFKKTLTKPGAPVQKFAPNGQPLLSGGLKPVYKPGKPVTSTKIDPVKVTGITGGAGLVAKNIFGGDGSTAPAEGTSNTRRVPTQGLLTTDANSSGVYNGSPFITPEDTEAPANKGEVEGGLSNLWSNMQKPGYWSDKVEGGSGGWDNRLFRLGEMMSYMGTPLSKRGKNPAERWTTATATANKAATDAAAAKAKLDKPVDLFSKIGNKTMVNAIKEKVAKRMGKDEWTSLDPDEADVLQASNEAIIAIQTMMSRNNPLTGQTYTYNEAEQMVLGSIK
jgi:hypothetical protein